ncbi:MAG TPA: S8 family peptidase [Arenimonas sp.]|nr:S8 family peptidase [Arenimonas sp.]
MIRLSVLAAATIAVLGVTSVANAGGRPDLVSKDLQSGKQYAAGQIIIQYNSYATATDKQRIKTKLGGTSVEALAKRGGGLNHKGDIDLVKFAAGPTMQSKLDAIKNDPSVDFAEPNWIVNRLVVSNDPYYTDGTLWGMYGTNTTPANQYGSQAGTAWTAASGANCSSVVVGVIDQGMMVSHPDLIGNAYKNPGDSTFNGRDDDRNGLIDDVYGWDFVSNDSSVFDGSNDYHGTHVAGTIGATGGNGIGVAGVCWNVKLMSAKFLGPRGGTSANGAKAIDYFTNLKLKGIPVVATNNSWGGGGYSQLQVDAIERAKAANILFITAAGNGGYDNDSSPSYPSSYPNDNIISVAALNPDGSMAYYSQYGLTSVDIGAPGTQVMSTFPQYANGKTIATYSYLSGTSMATPHVAGAAALYKARHPTATWSDIKAAILNSATPTPSLDGKVVTGGRLNITGF